MTVAALRGHSANLVGVPTGLLASAAFNDHPLPLHIRGVHEAHASLFDALAGADNLGAAGRLFQEYMENAFHLQQRDPVSPAPVTRRFRASYLRLLKGWGFDSNSREGAVMKGWVESRFGLFPTFHRRPLRRFASQDWAGYVEEKMSSRFHNNDIFSQLDLLYEFCQWSVTRWLRRGLRHINLYRGVNGFHEESLLGHGSSLPHAGTMLMRMNNIVSFTAHRDIACEFGDYILEASVPVVKLLFYNDLLPQHALRGEAEYLVIGGEYRVTVSYV